MSKTHQPGGGQKTIEGPLMSIGLFSYDPKSQYVKFLKQLYNVKLRKKTCNIIKEQR